MYLYFPTSFPYHIYKLICKYVKLFCILWIISILLWLFHILYQISPYLITEGKTLFDFSLREYKTYRA